MDDLLHFGDCLMDCPKCGKAARALFVSVECCGVGCDNFSQDMFREELMSTYDQLLKDALDEGATTSPGTIGPVEEELPFRDFCAGCNMPVEFARWSYPDGTASAWCPSCGHPNYWSTP